MTDAPHDSLHRLPTVNLTRPPRDIPTLFTAASIRGILADRKTQTRRLVTPRNTEFTSAPKAYWDHANFDTAFADGGKTAGYLHVHCHRDGGDMSCAECTRMGWEGTTHRLWPRVERGDRLWVRETWAMASRASDVGTVYYRASERQSHTEFHEQIPIELCGAIQPSWPKWKPAIHMPRAFSRIIREVTEVRIERLQSISEEDAIAEGMLPREGDGAGPGPGCKWSGTGYHGGTLDKFGGLCFHTPGPSGRCSCLIAGPSPAQCAYRELWDHINGPTSWAGNPWVVVTTFRRVA